MAEVIAEVLASDLVDDPRRNAAAEPLRARITAWRRRKWGREASLSAIALGGVGAFLVIARAIHGNRETRLDRSVVRAMGHARGPLTSAVMRGVTFFGSAPASIACSLVAVGLARKSPRLAAQVAIGALGGVAAELIFKRMFLRTRPTVLEHLEAVTSTSFPSGHAMASSCLYLTLAFVASRSHRLREHRTAIVSSAGALASAVGATRVYLGVHWPTDVLAGLSLGTAWACATEAAFDFAGADRIEREMTESVSPASGTETARPSR